MPKFTQHKGELGSKPGALELVPLGHGSVLRLTPPSQVSRVSPMAVW